MIIPDSELSARLRKGDVTAFDELYWRYHQVVYRNTLKLTKEPALAQDILQEAFIRLWEKKRDINFEHSVVNWLFVISFNLSVDYIRKKLREQTLHKNLLTSNIHATSSEQTTNKSSLYEEQYHLLKQAIDQLSPQKQKIITLCKLEGKTYEEAAAELQISRHTVKEYLSAAMASLSEYVRKHAGHTFIDGYMI